MVDRYERKRLKIRPGDSREHGLETVLVICQLPYEDEEGLYIVGGDEDADSI